MNGSVALFAGVAVALLVVFLGVWLLDKRRNDREKNDTDRLDVDNDGTGKRGPDPRP